MTTPQPAGAVVGGPRFWLRVEGLGAFLAGAVAFNLLGGDPFVFIVALLLVDVSMVGYLRGPAVGATIYNLAHNWFTAIAVLGIGYGTGTSGLVLAGGVVVDHVGGVRLASVGLICQTFFG